MGASLLNGSWDTRDQVSGLATKNVRNESIIFWDHLTSFISIESVSFGYWRAMSCMSQSREAHIYGQEDPDRPCSCTFKKYWISLILILNLSDGLDGPNVIDICGIMIILPILITIIQRIHSRLWMEK